MNTRIEDKITDIPPAERVLLLPHCLRRSETCQGKNTKEGLDCKECNPECPVNILKAEAVRLGYKGVCIAPGGSLALKYVIKTAPKAIVAVACDKELEEGMQAVRAMGGFGLEIPIVIIPLSKDGCVDTEVDIDSALLKIAEGCRKKTD